MDSRWVEFMGIKMQESSTAQAINGDQKRRKHRKTSIPYLVDMSELTSKQFMLPGSVFESSASIRSVRHAPPPDGIAYFHLFQSCIPLEPYKMLRSDILKSFSSTKCLPLCEI